MGIVDDDVRRVRDETDIIRIITEHTQLKKQGSQWMGLCPFHGEKSPSFSVNAEKGVYYCFGCQAKGDAIDFVRETEGLDFAGSVEFLAAKAGVTLRYTDRHEGRSRNRRREHAEHVGRAVDFYGAGIGNEVLVVESGEAGSQVTGVDHAPVRSVIVGIVD